MPSKLDYVRKQHVITNPQTKLFTALQKAVPTVPMFLNIDKNMSYWQEIGADNYFSDIYDLDRYCKTLALSTSFTYFPKVKYPDIWIPSKHLCLEVDGPTHNEVKDRTRDAWFQKNKIVVYRIKNNELNSEKKLQKIVKRIVGEFF